MNAFLIFHYILNNNNKIYNQNKQIWRLLKIKMI